MCCIAIDVNYIHQAISHTCMYKTVQQIVVHCNNINLYIYIYMYKSLRPACSTKNGKVLNYNIEIKRMAYIC